MTTLTLANLNFTGAHTPPANTAVNLNFGTSGSEEVDPKDMQLLVKATAPVFYTEGIYVSNTSRPTAIAMGTPWNTAKSMKEKSGGNWQDADKTRVDVDKVWEVCNQLHRMSGDRFEELDRHRVASYMPWEVAVRMDAGPLGELFRDLDRDRRFTEVPWQIGEQVTREVADTFVQLFPFPKFKVIPWKQAKHLPTSKLFEYGKAVRNFLASDIPWTEARKPPSGREVPVIPPVNPPYVPFYNLNFECKYVPVDHLNVLLNFGLHPCPGEEVPGVVARKVYFIVNSLHLTRVSDGTEIEILSASVGIDRSSWAWSFTGVIAYTEFEKVEPTSSGPVEVELEINSIRWRFLVEEYDNNEVFGKTNITVKGRSLTAYLGAPYAPVRSLVQSTATTSRQMADAEITRPGLKTGFSLDWMFPDELGWPMPANTWSFTNLSPIEVVNQIVQGAGGFVNSHPLNKSLIIRPEYFSGFWEWDAEIPDLILPRALIRSQSLKWTEKPLYNGVYVSGENTGVTALVRKLGTMGDFQAPAYVNPMISHNIAARLKGTSILSSGGKQASVSLEMPMEQSVGLITPGMLIEVVSAGVGPAKPSWRGAITSTSISASWSDTLKVSQSVDVERHYGGF